MGSAGAFPNQKDGLAASRLNGKLPKPLQSEKERIQLKNSVVLLILAVSLLSAAPSAAPEENTPCAVISGKVVFSGGEYVCLVQLEGDMDPDGQVIAQRFDKEGNLMETRTAAPEAELEMRFSNAAFSDHVRAAWMNAEGEMRCEAADIPFSVVYALDWMDFANVTAAIVRDYEGKIELLTGDPAFASGRLIVKAEGELPVLTDYAPELIVIDEENHYLIQFLQDQDALRCMEYLLTLPNVIYAEPDAPMYAGGGMETGL